MPAQQQKSVKGGKCLTTSESRKQHYARYGAEHGLATKGNKFTDSKEHRGCGPLARYNRRKIQELNAIADRVNGLSGLPLSDKTVRMMAYAKIRKIFK